MEKLVLKGKSVISLLILIFFFNCSANQIVSEIDDDKINILNSILNKSNTTVYYRTIIEDLNKPISFLLNQTTLNFNFCNKDIDPTRRVISDIEILFLKNKFKKQTTLKIDKINSTFKDKVTKKNERFKTTYITIPEVFRGGKMAIYYSNSTYGGEFTLLKKVNNKWEKICSSSVWLE